ncbi:MAG: ubiquinol-cytochrome c reductase iron-sulfur subunit [Candidatus Dormibacteria bacterium]|jgi:cytochrome b6-f complex iron-sulfur subunit
MALNPYDSPRGRMRSRVETTRRQFLLLVGTVGAVGATLFGGIELLKFMFPAATLESPPEFKTGFTVDDLTGNGTLKVNVLSETANRVTVVLDSTGIYAVYLVCTHLGCTPNYVSDVTNGTGVDDKSTVVARHYSAEAGAISSRNGWACPCHGSRYYIDSTNFYGPAPRPMDWVNIQLAPDKHFVVNRGDITVYRQAGDSSVPTWRLDPKTGKSNDQTIGV